MKVLIVCIVFLLFLNILNSKEYEKDNFINNIFFNDEPTLFRLKTPQVKKIMSKEMANRYKSPKIILRDFKGKRKMNRDFDQDFIYSKLTGSKIPLDNFKHNNMKPYFGGKLKQNMNVDIYSSKLENFTGVSETKCEKSSENCFGDVHKNVNDYAPSYLTQFERMEKPKSQNNILPTKQIKVGPGISDDKFSSKPSGGFQQTDLAHKANMFKSVDDLRSKSNPKTSYNGVVLEGQKGQKRAEMNEIAKNRVETFYEQTEDNLLKTTGAYTKPAMKPCQDVKKTTRQETVQEYKGGTYNPTKAIYNLFKSSGPTKRKELNEFGVRNVNVSEKTQQKDDYGKNSITMKQNERDLTSSKTITGNITTLIKSLVTPIQDILKPTQKEHMINQKRDFGGNVNGPNKLTIYDPNGVARTTIKETAIHDETTGNLKVYSANTVYDPSSIAKTTMKETLENYKNEINIKGSAKPKLYDREDKTKTTLKEVVENSERDGNVSIIQQSDGYRNSDFKAKSTNKEITSNRDYFGIAEKEENNGYINANVEAKNTQKELLSDMEYVGNSKKDIDEPQSYESIYNATINDLKENLLEEREPTTSSVKLNKGKEFIKNTKERNDCNMKTYRNASNFDKIISEPPNKKLVNVRNTDNEIESQRLDTEILSSLKSNPFVNR